MNLTLAHPAAAAPARGARLLAAAALAGIAWNAFGVVQWLKTESATLDSLTAGGLSPAQAALYLILPAWISVAFAVGVGAGLAGSVALLLRRHRHALVLLSLSLLAYAVLFAGDAWLGLFAAIPGQMAIPSVVVLIAIGLWALALHAYRQQIRH